MSFNWNRRATKIYTYLNPFHYQDIFIYSPVYHHSHHVCLENLVLDQLIIPSLIFFFILITCLFDIVLMLWGEVLSWSLMGVKGLSPIQMVMIIDDSFNFHSLCIQTVPNV